MKQLNKRAVIAVSTLCVVTILLVGVKRQKNDNKTINLERSRNSASLIHVDIKINK